MSVDEEYVMRGWQRVHARSELLAAAAAAAEKSPAGFDSWVRAAAVGPDPLWADPGEVAAAPARRRRQVVVARLDDLLDGLPAAEAAAASLAAADRACPGVAAVSASYAWHPCVAAEERTLANQLAVARGEVAAPAAAPRAAVRLSEGSASMGL